MYSSLKNNAEMLGMKRTRHDDMMSPGPRIWNTPSKYVDLLTLVPSYQKPYNPNHYSSLM